MSEKTPTVIREKFDSETGILTKWVEVEVPEYNIVEKSVVQKVEVVRYVPEKHVRKVERVVEEPFYDEVIREVPVMRVEEVIRHVPIRSVVEIPREIVKEVPVVIKRPVEKIVEIPGEVIEHDRSVIVEKKKCLPSYHDKKVPTVYSEKVQPVFRFTDDAVEVPTFDYDPVLCKVLVHIPKPIPLPIKKKEVPHKTHRWLHDIPDAEYNSLVKVLNPSLGEEKLAGLLIENALGLPIPDIRSSYTNWSYVKPLGLPTEPMPDPKPLRNAQYVRSIARQIADLTKSPNPNIVRASEALARFRQYKYCDPDMEQYLKEHHSYFSTESRVLTFREMKHLHHFCVKKAPSL